jgi:hypothetical protein
VTLVLDLAGREIEPLTAPMPDDGAGLEWAWACSECEWHPLRSFGRVSEVMEKQPPTHALEFRHVSQEPGRPWAQVAPVGARRIVELGALGEPMPRVAHPLGHYGGPVTVHPAAWSTTDHVPAREYHLLTPMEGAILVWDWLQLGILTPGFGTENAIDGPHRRGY